MKTESYSNALIRFILRHYIDIASGSMPIKKAADEGFIKGAGRKNPAESFLIWRSDVDQAISSLVRPGEDRWEDLIQGLDFEGIRDRLGLLPRIQRLLIKHCIFGECYWCKNMLDCPSDRNGGCDETGIISRMRRCLNGEGYDGADCQRHQAALLRGIDKIIEAMSSATRKAVTNLTKGGGEA